MGQRWKYSCGNFKFPSWHFWRFISFVFAICRLHVILPCPSLHGLNCSQIMKIHFWIVDVCPAWHFCRFISSLITFWYRNFIFLVASKFDDFTCSKFILDQKEPSINCFKTEFSLIHLLLSNNLIFDLYIPSRLKLGGHWWATSWLPVTVLKNAIDY